MMVSLYVLVLQLDLQLVLQGLFCKLVLRKAQGMI